jgi:RNA polymerase sigma-70 factor (ECF subfamily)
VSSGPPHERREEFEQVALPHLDALFNLALSLTRNRKDAEDLVQETYLRAFRFFDSYEPGTHVKAWLFRILRNTFVNRYRAARRTPEHVDFGAIEEAYESLVEETFRRRHEAPDPERALLARVPDEAIRRALAELPEEYRTVVVLALVEELSYKEIASALGIPIGTVMSRLHRGRKHLQRELLEHARSLGIVPRGSGVSTSED